MIEVAITAEERELVSRHVNGRGGFQDLLLAIQAGIRGDRLRITQENGRRLIRYARGHGDGGWQRRLRPLADRVEAALRAAPDDRGEDMLG